MISFWNILIFNAFVKNHCIQQTSFPDRLSKVSNDMANRPFINVEIGSKMFHLLHIALPYVNVFTCVQKAPFIFLLIVSKCDQNAMTLLSYINPCSYNNIYNVSYVVSMPNVFFNILRQYA